MSKELAPIKSEQVKSFYKKENNANPVLPSENIAEVAPTFIDILQLSSQMKTFQKRVTGQINKKFETAYVDEFNKKKNSYKKEYAQSIFNNIFEEKNYWLKASVKNEIENTQLILYFSFFSCDRDFKKLPSKIDISDACYYMSYYSFVNNKWSFLGIAGNFGPGEWYEGRPYLSLFTEYLGDYMKVTNTVQLFVPFPTTEGQLLSLKYKNGKFLWESDNEIVWKSTTENEIKNFEKYVDTYTKEHEGQ